jgi:hypothetical protein
MRKRIKEAPSDAASNAFAGTRAAGLKQGGTTMRYLKYFLLLGVLMAFPLVQSQAQVRVGVGIGFGPGYVAGPPACAYGYYDYAPYACAPYGYYGPNWFANGIFIGAGPWYHGYGWGRGYYGRAGWGYGRGYYGGRGFYHGAPAGGFHGGYAGHGYVGHGAVGGGFHGAAVHGGGGFHGGGGRR